MADLSFVKALPTSAARGKLTLPLRFVKKHLMHLIGKEFELASHPEAKFTWQGSLQLRKNKDREEYTLKGWKLYAEAQKLAAGDQVAFELVSHRRLVIALVHKASTAWMVSQRSGEDSQTNAESQTQTRPACSSLPEYSSRKRSQPYLPELVQQSRQRLKHLMKGSFASDMPVEKTPIAAAQNLATKHSFGDVPFGAASLTANAALPQLSRPERPDNSLESAALQMLARAYQGQKEQPVDFGQLLPERTKGNHPDADKPDLIGQRVQPAAPHPRASLNPAKYYDVALVHEHQPVSKRQRLSAEGILSQQSSCSAESQQAPEMGRYTRVLESILGQSSENAALLKAPVDRVSNAKTRREDMMYLEAIAEGSEFSASPESPVHLPVRSPAQCSQQVSLDIPLETLRETLLEHSRLAVHAVLGLQLSLRTIHDAKAQGFLTRLLEVLRSQLMTLADCGAQARH